MINFPERASLRLSLSRVADVVARVGSSFRRWLLAGVCALCVSCAVLPDRVVGAYNITQAHAVSGGSLWRLSYMGFNSFVFGHDGATPTFQRRPLVVLDGDQATVRIFPSSRLIAAGFDSDAASRLAGHLLLVHGQGLPMYIGRPVPVARLDIRLVHPSERLTDRGRSFSSSRQHRVRFAFSFDPDHGPGADRSIVRTLAHELLHASLAVHGRREKPGPDEEQAAYSIEHCVELEVFGDTSAPTRKIIARDPGRDAVMTSLVAGHATDPTLQAVFDGDPNLSTERAGPLRELCKARVRALAGYTIV